MDDNMRYKKRMDVARVLIQTSSWEFIHSLLKVRVNDVV